MSFHLHLSPPRLAARLEARLRRAYARLGASGSGVLLAVSGGADSTALLIASSVVAGPLGLRLEVAVLDHGLRPEAQTETSTVQRLGQELGVRVHVERLNVAHGPGLEARAREARYAALCALGDAGGLPWVATGHTASDQAETLLMRLARGSALRGAAGVRAERGRFIRPLLDWSRDEVLAYLKAQGRSFHVDAMNRDPSFLRVRVRQDALPALERAAGGAVVSRLARFAKLAAEDDALLCRWADASLARLALGDGALDVVGVRALSPPIGRRVIARFLEGQDVPLDYEVVEGALALLHGGAPCPVGGDRTLRVVRGRLVLTSNPRRRRPHRPV